MWEGGSTQLSLGRRQAAGHYGNYRRRRSAGRRTIRAVLSDGCTGASQPSSTVHQPRGGRRNGQDVTSVRHPAPHQADMSLREIFARPFSPSHRIRCRANKPPTGGPSSSPAPRARAAVAAAVCRWGHASSLSEPQYLSRTRA